MPLNILRNDITLLSCDAIVNPANPSLLPGGGVCGAVFAAAGEQQLTAACRKIGFCDVGQAVITKGFHLKAAYIIHTVGPVYGKNHETEEKQLYACYENSLLLAKRKKLRSVAFPLISSGAYGYPKEKALKIATRAIKDFLDRNEMQVYLVVYDRDSFAISENMFAAVESFLDERMVIPQTNRFAQSRSECRTFRMPSPADRGEVYSGDTDTDETGTDETLPHKTATDEIGAVNADNADADRADAVEINQDAVFNPQEDGELPWDTEPEDDAGQTRSFPAVTSAKESKPTRSLSDLIARKVETFSEMLLRLIDEKGMTDVEVYKRANIDRKLFSKIRKKNYTPKKTTVIALAISLRLNMDEAKDLLSRAGFAFSECNKFDIIIEYFIENQNYDIFEINETLFAFDEQVLGA